MGGVGEFGSNFTGYYIDGNLYMVDCGILFGDDSKLGVDALIPDIFTIIEALGGVKAYLITHGHEDHIGAVPIFFERWPAPLYSARWTIHLLKERLQMAGIPEGENLLEVRDFGEIQLPGLHCIFIPTNHSIPMACSLLITAGGRRVFHTGDFKIDANNPHESPMDLARVRKICKARPIDLMVSDSTNSTRPGDCPSESETVEPIRQVIQAAEQLVVFTTFSSNVWRFATLLQVCHEIGRKVALVGGGVVRHINLARKLGLIKVPDGLIIDDQQLKSYPKDQLVIIASGSQGEHRSALTRIIQGDHPKVSLEEGDTVVYSSKTIPGNEKIVAYFKSLLAHAGVNIVSVASHPSIHVSGHGYQGDIAKLLAAVSPIHHMPVHGTYTQLLANGELTAGDAKIIEVENGAIVEVDKAITTVGQLEISKLFIDSYNRRLMTKDTLRERLRIGESGACFVSGIIRGNQKFADGQFQFFGLPFGLDPESATKGWPEKLTGEINRRIEQLRADGKVDIEELSEAIRIVTRQQLKQVFIKKPVVVVNLHRG